MVTLTGVLVKRGRIRKTWKSRFFALNGDTLVYYTKAGGARKGHVPVADARVSKLEGVPGHKHVFSVCTAGGVTLALEAASEEDCARWMAALQLASASTVVLQASLHKYHRWRKTWNRRFFILSTMRLRWFKHQGGKLLGEMPTAELHAELLPDETAAYSFKLSTDTKDAVLRAENPDELHKWLNAVKTTRVQAQSLEKRFNREESSRRVGGDGAPSQTAASDSDSDVANPTAAGDESSGVSDVETIPSSSDDDDVVDQRPNVSPAASPAMPQPNEAGPGQLDTLDMGIVSLEEIARRGVDSDASSSDTSVEVEDQWQQLRAHRGTSNAKRTTGARHKAARHRRAAMRDPTARAGFAVSDGSLWSARSGRGGQVVSAVVGGEGAAGGGEAANASGGGEGTPTHPSGKPVVHFPAEEKNCLQLTLVLTRRAEDVPDLPRLNHWQNRQCANCLATQTSGYFGRGVWSYYCHYTELMFCKHCYGDQKARIPWRVVHNLDTDKYPVSKPAWDYLRIMKEAGVIELLKYNPERWVADESWMEFVDTRKRLQSLLQQANEEAGQAEIERVLPGREYMYKTTSMISLDDLLIQGKLLDTVTDVAEEFAQFAAVHPRVRPESESKAEGGGVASKVKKSLFSLFSSSKAQEAAPKRAMDLTATALPHSGFLMKRGARRTAWQKRWIDLEFGVMVYRKDKFGPEKGKLALSGDSTVHKCSSSELKTLEPKRRPRKRVMCIYFKQASRKVYLQASSDDELDEWMDAFREHIDSARSADGLEQDEADLGGDEAKTSADESSPEEDNKESKVQDDDKERARKSALAKLLDRGTNKRGGATQAKSKSASSSARSAADSAMANIRKRVSVVNGTKAKIARRVVKSAVKNSLSNLMS